VAHLHEPVQVIKHVHVHKDTITEERIAMQKLQSEDEDLRRMCSELQRVVDETVQKVHYVLPSGRPMQPSGFGERRQQACKFWAQGNCTKGRSQAAAYACLSPSTGAGRLVVTPGGG
jgi:hypothetical protein